MIVENWYNFFLKCLVEFCQLTHWSLALSVLKGYYYWYNFVKNIYIQYIYSSCLFLLWVLVDCVFQGIHPFQVGCQICGHRVVWYSFIVLLISMESVVLSLPLFLKLVICVFLLFLVSLTRDLLILWIFSKKQFLKIILFKYSWFTMLFSAVWQSDLVIHVYVHFHVLFHFCLPQGIEHSSLCYAGGPCCLSILYMIVCIC